jgi:hypothetical protein
MLCGLRRNSGLKQDALLRCSRQIRLGLHISSPKNLPILFEAIEQARVKISGRAKAGAVTMTHAVNLQVEAKVTKACIFRLEADGWTGICEELSVTVQGGSFEDVKRAMEAALQEPIETVLRENPKTSARQAA